MNRQFSRLITALVLLVTLAFIGCDLGTYNKRFKERNNPAAKAKAAEKDSDAAESSDSN